MVKGEYKSVEKVFLAASFFYITYIFAGVLSAARLEGRTGRHVQAARPHGVWRQAYLYMVIGVVGTTIAPWMQFYLQSSIVEKGVTPAGYKARGSM